MTFERRSILLPRFTLVANLKVMPSSSSLATAAFAVYCCGVADGVVKRWEFLKWSRL